jgi:sugar lactone lactonase YvrE
VLFRSNGPTFSPDGATLYHTDNARRVVYAFDLNENGALANKRVFVRFEDAWGYPDGMTTDSEGGVWIAHWDGARVSRFTPDGALDRSIALPVSRPTSCVFAGDELERMFVTSASIGREDEPLAGGLFEIDPGVRGAPAHMFAG